MPANETIRVSIRVRPVTDGELVRYPPPLPVHAAPGEVRLYNTPAAALHAPKARDLSSSLAVIAGAKRAAGAPPAPLPLPTGSYQAYPFSAVFGPEASDDQVYVQSGCHKVVASVCQGCNGTVFVYGQTGAGKTFTCDALTTAAVQQVFAYGAAGVSSSSSSEGGADAAPSTSRAQGPAAAAPASPPSEEPGCGAGSMDVSVSVCVLELYNEVLRCLLSGKEVVLMMGPGGLLLDGAVEQPCSSAVALQAAIASAKANRVVGETRANARSSRSHLIIRIRVQAVATQAAASSSHAAEGASASTSSAAAGAAGGGPGSCTCTCGVLNLVDLAGSERVDKTGSADSTTRLREALNINKSLLCLGNVVTALADSTDGRKVHVPYRDSKLTRLLEDSLGGSARTALLACITPLPDWHLELTKATLAFAARAARIVCRPQRNMVVLPAGPGGLDQQALVEALQAEVAALRAQLAAAAAAASAAQQLVGPGGRLSRASSTEHGLSSPRSASLLLQQSSRPPSQPLPMMDEGDGEAGDQDQAASSSGKVGRSTLLWRLIAGPRLHPPPGGLEDQGAGGAEATGDSRVGVLAKRWATFAVRKSRTALMPGSSEAGSSSSATPGGHAAGFSASLPSAGSGSSGWGSQLDVVNSLPGSRLVFSVDGCVDGTGRRQWSSGGGAVDPSSGVGGELAGRGVADSLVPQLLGVLAAKKAELASLQQQLAGMTTQLGKAAADKERQDRQLCELAAGLSALSAARQAERRNWAAQLEALEGGLEGARAEVEQHRTTASQLRQQLRELVEKQQQQQQQAPNSSAAVLPPAALGDLQLLLAAVAQHQPSWLADLPLKLDVPALQRLVLQQQQAEAGALDRCPSHPVAVDSLSGSGTPRASLVSTGAVPCKKCEATKPLLAFLQKLKEQVQLLGQQLAAKEEELAATRTAAALLRSQLARLGGGCAATSSLGLLSSSGSVLSGGATSPRTSASPITTQ